MRKITVIALLCLALNAGAWDVKEALHNIPDTIFPSLSRNNILDMVDFKEANMKAEVANRLGGKSEMLRLTGNFTEIKLSDNCIAEMKTVNIDGEDRICLVETFTAPAAQSSITFYDSKWKRLQVREPQITVDDLTCKPDTMDETTFKRLQNNIWPVMKKINIDDDTDNIDYCLSMPLINEEEKTKTNAILTQKSVKITDFVLIK